MFYVIEVLCFIVFLFLVVVECDLVFGFLEVFVIVVLEFGDVVVVLILLLLYELC